MKRLRHFLFAIITTFAFCTIATAQEQKWQTIHQVKKKETIFGIARQYGITIDELLDANPPMRTPGYELKKGEAIYVPFAKPAQPQKPAVAPQPKSINVGILLPLHDVDGDGRRMTEYYRGLLLGVKKLKANGVNVNVKAWNVNQETDVSKILLEDGMTEMDIMFGPLYTKQVKTIGDFCKAYGVKLVIPFSISGNDVDSNPMIYQVYQSNDDLNDATITHFLERFSDYHPVFIDCNDTTSRKGIFTFGLRKKLETKGISYNITNLRSSDEMFAKSFSLTKRNIVILNTGRSPQLTQAIQKLNILTDANKNVQVSLFGYTDWLMYQKYNNNLTYFCKYDTYIPSTFYYNEEAIVTKNFETEYTDAFHSTMMNAIPRFAIVGYDQALFFIGGIHKYADNFKAVRSQQYSTPLQTSYNFGRSSSSSGYRNCNLQFIHYRRDGAIESITY